MKVLFIMKTLLIFFFVLATHAVGLHMAQLTSF